MHIVTFRSMNYIVILHSSIILMLQYAYYNYMKIIENDQHVHILCCNIF